MAAYNSCYLSSDTEIGTSNTFVMGVDLGASFFQHAIYIEQNKQNGYPWTHIDVYEYL